MLSEETKKRTILEKKVKELEEQLEAVEDIEKMEKLKIVNDNLQQQLVLQMEKISTLEKQLKQLKAEKLEYETKYEERVLICVFKIIYYYLGIFYGKTS